MASERNSSPGSNRRPQRGGEAIPQGRPKLAKRFRDEIKRTLNRVITAPLQFPVIRNDRRRALVTTFPYYILFEVRGDQIGIMAILHTKRHPDTGFDREIWP